MTPRVRAERQTHANARNASRKASALMPVSRRSVSACVSCQIGKALRSSARPAAVMIRRRFAFVLFVDGDLDQAAPLQAA